MMKTKRRTYRQRKHGIESEYPANWKKIATATKEAAHWRCVRCMHPHERPWVATSLEPVSCDLACRHDVDNKQRMLTTHHLDMDKGNSAWWNLAALCQVCHLSIQARVDWHQYYLFEHSRWMLPYLKGWMRWQITGITVVNLNYVSFDQYIGRPNKRLRRKYRTMQLDNAWENPFRITTKRTREMSIAEYRVHIIEAIQRDPKRYNLASLLNTTLGCWCKPLACHGDEIVELAADMVIETTGERFAAFQSILAA